MPLVALQPRHPKRCLGHPASTVNEAGDYTFTATLSNPSQGITTIVTDQGTITIGDGQTSGTLVVTSGNGEDVYLDASTLTATILSATGGNFENLAVDTASAMASVNDTIDDTTVNLSASTVNEAGDYTFTATLSNPSQGITTIVTDQGTITIGDGQTSGTLVVTSGNGEDVYLDASTLTATILSATGGNFESLVIGTASATAYVNDTIDTTTVSLSGSVVFEGAVANYTFTATLSNPSQGDTTIVTDQGTITIGDGQTSGSLVIASGNNEDVYLDASSLVATILSATGGNFESLVIGTASATAYVNDTIDITMVDLTGFASFYDNAGHYTFTATLSSPSQGETTIVTDQGTIVIGDGESSGSIVITSTALSMSAIISSASGGNFEQLNVDDASEELDAPVAGLTISGMKYNDLDQDGTLDTEEDGIASWTIAITYTSWVTGATTVNVTTDADGNYTASFNDAVIGSTYIVQEINSDPSVWTEIEGLSGYTGSIASTGTTVADADFGNHHSLITQAGKTIGFWSNKNGAAIISANGAQSGSLKSDVFALLKSLNLRNADGTFLIKAADTSLATKTFQTWLTAATAKNMANMLSAQLAATVLNVSNSLVDSGLLVDFSAVATLNSAMISELNAKSLGSTTFQLETVAELISAAKAELALNGTTIVSSNVRTYQEALKNIFDAINNNKQIFAFV